MTISLTDRTRERKDLVSYLLTDYKANIHRSLFYPYIPYIRLVEKGPQSSIENDIESTFSPRSVQNFSVVFKFIFVIKLFSDFLQYSNISKL